MKSNEIKIVRRVRRKRRLRKTLIGTPTRPRLTVFRSLKNIYAQVIDDSRGVTICSASTRDKDFAGGVKSGGNCDAAAIVGKALAERAKQKNVQEVSFDRNGFKYHGRLKALADAAREAGMKF
jgi:large subunit ribosomal protein L18